MDASANDKPTCQSACSPLAEILELFRAEFPEVDSSLGSLQQRIITKIIACGKHELGYIHEYCSTCHTSEFVGWCHCNDRNCSNCGARYRAEWCQAVQERLPDGRYFHVVFTIPHEFNQLLFTDDNRWIIYDSVMKAAAETLRVFAKNKLNAEPFILSVLHTWSQDLSMHIHSHSLVSAEMFDAENGKWRQTKDFLFPIHAMAKVFRGKFMSMLAKHLGADSPKRCLTIKNNESRMEDWLSFAESLPKKWNVYVSKPRKSHNNVIKYFACYANRTAITHSRIAGYDKDNVRLRPKRRDSNEPEPGNSYAQENRNEPITLPLQVFVKRLCSHFLPRRFVRIRYYGLASPSSKSRPKPSQKSTKEVAPSLLPQPERAICRHCSAKTVVLIVVRKILHQGISKRTERPLWQNTS
jgi:Putative transposase/Transposase zinc-binding domain